MIVDKAAKPCDCEKCDFREVVFSNLGEQSILELCALREEKSFRKGEIIKTFGKTIEVADINKLEIISKRG